MNKKEISLLIIGMEIHALERWNNGDPSGYLEISDNDVVYFDPFLEKRLDGLEGLKNLYESLRGNVDVDSYDFIDPLVQAVDNMAVLSFNLVSNVKDKKYKWNCTEVYRLNDAGQWRIIQTHWSFTKPSIL